MANLDLKQFCLKRKAKFKKKSYRVYLLVFAQYSCHKT